MTDKKSLFKKKAAKKAKPAPAPAEMSVKPVVPAKAAVGRPRSVVKLTAKDLGHELNAFISSISSRSGLTADEIAEVALYMVSQQTRVCGPTVMAGRIKVISDAING